MRFLYKEFVENIYFTENKIPVLIIENKNFFNNLIIQIYEQKLDNKIENYKLFVEDKDLSNKSDVIIEPFSLSVDNKEVRRVIENKIITKFTLNSLDIDQILNPIFNMINEILIDLPLDIHMDTNLNLKNLIKIYQYFIYNNNENILEKITEYIKVMIELNLIEVFIFINIKLYLDEKDLESFYKFVELEEINVLLIENKNRLTNLNESKVIIDKELCLIY